MSQTIRTYKDLCEERERMKSLLEAQRLQIKEDWQDLKDEFLPVKKAFGVVGKMTHADKSNPLINAGLNIASDLFLKNFVLGKAGLITRLAVPFVMKNLSSHMIAEKGGSFFGKVVNLIKGKRTKQPEVNGQPSFKSFQDE